MFGWINQNDTQRDYENQYSILYSIEILQIIELELEFVNKAWRADICTPLV